jgi:glycine dehydrogenase subunit 1
MYVPNQGDDLAVLLHRIGVKSVEELFRDIPAPLRLQADLDIPGPFAEWEVLRILREMAARNTSVDRITSFLGGGCYDHHVPASIAHLLRRSEFSTAYTPYQPEVSQGTLQAIFEFQTYMARLTGMDVSNASLYDGATALAEAVLMGQRVRPGRKGVLLSGAVHPEYRDVVRTVTRPLGLELLEPPPTPQWETDWPALQEQVGPQTSCVVVQNPNFFGTLEDLDHLRATACRSRDAGALFIVVVAAPISLGLLVPPGEYGADVVAGEGQSLGIPMAFGGPHLGFLTARTSLLRQMPGRMVGQTQDVRGNRGFVLTLATREQHIRRERATSNICTNQSLCALAATIYLSQLGRCGLERVAGLNLQRTREAMEAVAGLEEFQVRQRRVFNEFVVKTPLSPGTLNEALLQRGILGGLDLGRFDPRWEGEWLLCCTEKRSPEEIRELVRALTEVVS